MKPNKIIVTLLALGGVFAAWQLLANSTGGCALRSGKPADSSDLLRTSTSETAPAQTAPDWELPGLDGKLVKLSSFQGKVVVLNFWATWCPPCRREIPDLVALQKKYAAEGLVVIGVSLDESGAAAVKSFAAKTGINYPVVMGDRKTAEAYGGITAIPTTFIINREGKLAGGIQGGADLARLESAIKPAL